MDSYRHVDVFPEIWEAGMLIQLIKQWIGFSLAQLSKCSPLIYTVVCLSLEHQDVLVITQGIWYGKEDAYCL